MVRAFSRPPSFSLSQTSATMPFRHSSRGASLDEEQPVPGVEVDRISFINTALIANPGIALRTFFAPVISLKSVLLQRRRLTQRVLEDPAWLKRRYKDAIAALVRVLSDASTDLFDTPIQVDEQKLAEALEGKLVPMVYEPGAVLAYPGELPETMFVHVVLVGSVRVVTYQLQNRKGAFGDGSKRQYFVSNDTIRLGGSVGLRPDLLKHMSSPVETSTDGTSEVASTSNMSTAIQRSLRRMSRMIGQPTLLPIRTEVFRAPYMACATETLGLEPHRLATVLTEATVPTAREEGTANAGFTETMRIRAKDLHEALIQMAASRETQERVPLNTTVTSVKPMSPNAPGRHPPTMRDYMAAARVKSISRHYPLNEVLMRQSWLLQDTPAHTIRALVTQLTPRTFFPGDAILCPHTTARQLCFLRRGAMTIEEPPSLEFTRGSVCRCAQGKLCRVLEDVPVGASFGELSVLFGEPRQFVLRAKTVCDVWCLSRHCFAETVRRDDALRESLLSKAAALRMRWLGEQRFTTTLARQLRESCELFREASDSFIRLVQERLEPHVYPPGTLLTSTSTRCEYMFIILQGRVSSIVDGIAEYGPGSVLGEPTIIYHRWPIAAVSKTMVEGWRLGRNDLIDALNRIEMLRQHSGEVGGHTAQLMQCIFRAPVPPSDVDVLGRPRMPIVGAPPRGATYMKYAQRLAELQLQCICFRFRDFISWEDICYQTLSTRRITALPASVAIGEEKLPTKDVTPLRTAKPTQENVKSPQSPDPLKGARSARRAASGAGGTRGGAPVRRAKRDPLLPVHTRKTRAQLSAACTFSFHVNPLVVHQPFAHPHHRREEESQPDRQDPFLTRLRAIKATQDARVSRESAPLPQLVNCLSLCDARDKLRRTEARQKIQQQQSLGGEAHLVHTQDIAATVSSPAAAAAAVAAAAAAAAAIMGTAPGNASHGRPAPVHIFHPRVQITVEEAVAVGYVLQLPDTRHIQSCVSAIDSDVTVGLPQHRLRRRAMAATPNDRHHRHSFLFAASKLGERSAGEVIVREAAEQEVDSRERAQYLSAVISARLATRHESHRDQKHSAEEMSDTDVLGAAAEWNLHSPLHSPGTSPSALRSPARPQSLVRPSVRDGEAMFLQLMRENPERALGNLRVRFQVADAGPNADAPDILSTARGLSASVAPRDELLEGLRQAMAADLREPGAPPAPRRQSAEPNAESAESEGGASRDMAGPAPLDIVMQENWPPLFVDGYGELAAAGTRAPSLDMNPCLSAGQSLSHAPSQASAMASTCAAPPQRGSGGGGGGGPLALAPAPDGPPPPRFVMPDVSEATAAMRRIQRDVEGLNAVAEEQRRERARRAPPSAQPPLPTPLPGAQRLVDEWAAEYHDKARDPFTLARIPAPLLAEAGTDYLTEAYAATRRLFEGSEPLNGANEYHDHTRGAGGGDTKQSQCVYAPIGARKLGRKSRLLINPMAKMSREDYQRWEQERDELFASTKLPPATV